MTEACSSRELGQSMRAGHLSSRALVERSIDLAKACDSELGIYVDRYDEQALAAADIADAELKAGLDRGPLHGLPVAIKDVLATREGVTTAQSLVHDRSWWAGRDALVVERLRAAGAVIVGKATTMEFALGLPDASKPFPVPKNPWDRRRWPGGSSSGSASGVAAGVFPLAIGSDTGGSIRLPSALCGVTGLKPTFGLVPTHGLVPLAPGLDHIGPIARDAWGCGALFDAIADLDTDRHDSGKAQARANAYSAEPGLSGVRVGVVRLGQFVKGEDPAILAAFDAAVTKLNDLGAIIEELELPLYAEVTAATLVTLLAEAGASHQQSLQERWSDYFVSTREIMSWVAFLSPIDYVNAQRVRRVARRRLAELFNRIDVVMTPTATIEAPTYEAIDEHGAAGVLDGAHTLYWDAVGNPALAVPIGFGPAGLPLSAQVAGPPFGESRILAVGREYQACTNWHLRRPPEVVTS